MKRGFLIGAALVLVSCGGKPTPKEAEKEKPIIKDPIAVETTNGDATIRSILPPRAILYRVTWQKGELNVANTGIYGGTLTQVSGDLYDKKGQLASTFKADEATANKEKQLLTLIGHVQVVSKTNQATMSCDKLEWHATEHLARATGNVTASGKFGTLGPSDEMWSNPDLKIISTPDLIKHP